MFKKQEDTENALPAVSSSNPYPFTLAADRLENWQKTLAELAGKQEKTGPEK